MYIIRMKYEWNSEKNELSKKERRISFEQIVFHLSQGDVWKISDHPDKEKYPGQKIYFVNVEGYIYLVPHMIADDYVFLKTIIPSRKATRDFNKGVNKMKLDKEEKGILDAYEKGSMNLSIPSRKEKEQIKSMAEKTFRKDRRVTIRLYDHDLKGIQKKAMGKGMPYQTLISGMIHQYIEGDLVENKVNRLASAKLAH